MNEYKKKYYRNKRLVTITQITLVTLFIFFWEILSRKGIINSFIFSSPSKIVITLKDLLLHGNLLLHIYVTLKEVLIAFTLGAILGLFIALILYSSKFINKVFDPFLTMLNSLPKVALGPIIIIWMGANNKSIILMALLINLIVCIQTILNGFNETDKNKIKLLKSFNATRIQIIRYLIIPSSFRILISSLKINISMSLIGVIMGEFLVSKEGIGYLIIYGKQTFNLDLVMSGITILIFLSYLLYISIEQLEKYLLKNKTD